MGISLPLWNRPASSDFPPLQFAGFCQGCPRRFTQKKKAMSQTFSVRLMAFFFCVFVP